MMYKQLIVALVFLAGLHCGQGIQHALRVPTRPIVDVLEHVDHILQRELDLLGGQREASSVNRFTVVTRPRSNAVQITDPVELEAIEKLRDAGIQSSFIIYFPKMYRLYAKAAKAVVASRTELQSVAAAVGENFKASFPKACPSFITRTRNGIFAAGEQGVLDFKYVAEEGLRMASARLKASRRALAATGEAVATWMQESTFSEKLMMAKKVLKYLVGFSMVVFGIIVATSPPALAVEAGVGIAGLAFNLIMAGWDAYHADCKREAGYIIIRAVLWEGALSAFGLGVLNGGADAIMSLVMKPETSTTIAAVLGVDEFVTGIVEDLVIKCPCGAKSSGKSCAVYRQEGDNLVPAPDDPETDPPVDFEPITDYDSLDAEQQRIKDSGESVKALRSRRESLDDGLEDRSSMSSDEDTRHVFDGSEPRPDFSLDDGLEDRSSMSSDEDTRHVFDGSEPRPDLGGGDGSAMHDDGGARGA